MGRQQQPALSLLAPWLQAAFESFLSTHLSLKLIAAAELVRLAQELGIQPLKQRCQVSGVRFQVAEYGVSGVEGKKAPRIPPRPSALDTRPYCTKVQ